MVLLINENLMQFQEPSNDTMSIKVSFPWQGHLCKDFSCSCIKSKMAGQSQRKPAFKEGISRNFKPFTPLKEQSPPTTAKGKANLTVAFHWELRAD